MNKKMTQPNFQFNINQAFRDEIDELSQGKTSGVFMKNNQEQNIKEDRTETKSEKFFYPLTSVIKDEIKRHVDNIQEILEYNEESKKYLLQGLVLGYSKNNKDSLCKFIYDSYSKNLSTSNYNKLLDAVNVIDSLINGKNPLLNKEKNEILSLILKKEEINSFKVVSEYEKAVPISVLNELIETTNLSLDEVKSMGEIYKNII